MPFAELPTMSDAVKPSHFFSPDPTAKVSSSGSSNLVYTYSRSGWSTLTNNDVAQNGGQVTLNDDTESYEYGLMYPDGYQPVTQSMVRNQTTFYFYDQYADGTSSSFRLSNVPASEVQEAVQKLESQ